MPLKGSKFTEQHKKAISDGCKKSGVGKWMIGRKLSIETRKKLSQNHSRYNVGVPLPNVWV